MADGKRARHVTGKDIRKMTNKEFAEKDDKFKSVCEKLGIKPTVRQASKWRNKKGVAWKSRGVAQN